MPYKEKEIVKKYYTIGQVADMLDVATSLIRFWETEFKRINPKRTPSGQRLYRKKDVELILKIRHLLYEKKFTIQGAKQYLKSEGVGKKDKLSKITIDGIRLELENIRDLVD